ncbi:MAG: DUF169 domain-containing protein [Methanomicrobiales archaeon]|nr:DUF169 domain-containing protein [Methanomicrobiales archaeon]
MATAAWKEIGEQFSHAFHLKDQPLTVYGSESVPSGAIHLSEVNRCFAVSLFQMSSRGDPSTIYVGTDESEGCCVGGLSHMGFISRPDSIKYFVSTGKSDVRGGAAEYLKANPELVEAGFNAAGRITPPGRYLIIQNCDAVPQPDPGVRSLCFFGNAEQIRNLAALVHFDREDPFYPVIIPWGPSCATLISYPAGLAEGAPKQTAFVGPQDPTQNRSLPPRDHGDGGSGRSGGKDGK